MINNKNIEKNLIQKINDNIKYIEEHSDLSILYDKELHNNETYINIRLYDSKSHELVTNRLDKLVQVYHFILALRNIF